MLLVSISRPFRCACLLVCYASSIAHCIYGVKHFSDQFRGNFQLAHLCKQKAPGCAPGATMSAWAALGASSAVQRAPFRVVGAPADFCGFLCGG